ncbi:MAG TPA: A/G-specific adenine glycosylase [Bryobacteraceae bacterium]|nr:A/G-specific adenine glycosylase [Bryobacteraceae bacterium]
MHSSNGDVRPDAGLKVLAIRRRLLAWYQEHKRDLPWRRTRDPYRIWISEIMLQQTRVAAAVPYYVRFLERFPNVRALARVRERDLLAAWAGLGYYARARNLQKAARKILTLGAFPSDYASIRQLAGVGDYTAAAIASIAFGLKRAAVDGNAVRVLSRLTAEPGNVAASVVRARLGDVANRLMDPKRPGDFNQALMELGATVCAPKQPQCAVCPVEKLCAARQSGREHELPVRFPRSRPIQVQRQLLVVEEARAILAWRRSADSRRLANFWELPELEQLPGATVGPKIAEFRHSIVNVNYIFHVHRASAARIPKGFRWLAADKLKRVLLSTTAKKALAFSGLTVA